MIGKRKWAGRASAVTAMAAATTLVMGGVAFADTLQDTIADDGTGVTLVAGSSTGGTAAIRVVGNNAAGDPDPGCNIDSGENPLMLDIRTPAGVTANPDPLAITGCGQDFSVSFTASSSAVSGRATVTVLSGPAGGGTYVNQVDIPITVTQPANTAPAVSVTGVENGSTYRTSNVPLPGCSVVDAEDSGESAEPQISNGAFNALGSHTVTCSYTDGGNVTRSATATYTVIRDLDTTAPVITKTVSGTLGDNGWYTSNVTVDWTVTETESPETLSLTGCEDVTITADQAVTDYTCSATSEGGTAAKQKVSIGRDTAKPTNIAINGGPAANGSYFFGDVPAAPDTECTADDAISGLATCVVTGYSNAVGPQTLTAEATDNAGNSDSITSPYTVKAWDLKGFYSPVDMGGTLNTVKGGSTVPLKFEMFAGSELTSTSAIDTFVTKKVSCATGAGVEDAIEVLSTGGTSLRYDSTGGQFIQNWKTPTGAGTCYLATMTADDGSSITALFKIK